uniref:Uncharacterized protein n=1 Tax=Arundo donax TaxID=35708 RepID=A0A0A9HKS9_ARUDO
MLYRCQGRSSRKETSEAEAVDINLLVEHVQYHSEGPVLKPHLIQPLG